MSNFNVDYEFLKMNTDVILLSDENESAMVIIAPQWQGRVMTSSATGMDGASFGWINRELISSGKLQDHINVFGGEDRFWLGPEGGQYSIFFKGGTKFELNDWYVPKEIDTEPFEVINSTRKSASFTKTMQLENYSGTEFDIKIDREVNLLNAEKFLAKHGLNKLQNIKSVMYESKNVLTNIGKIDWKKETGLLSIWILGMFNPTPNTIVVIPFRTGTVDELGEIVNDVYFGKVNSNRLAVRDSTIFFKGDGLKRSKIGVSPKRCKSLFGSYDFYNKTLTIIEFNYPDSTLDYVNSLWELQDEPYSGDAVNSYNDGPPEPNKKPLGPFYELESSSPAVELKVNESLTHIHKTIHFTGAENELDKIAVNLLGVSLSEIGSVF